MKSSDRGDIGDASPAERAAADAFVHVMRTKGVPYYGVAVQWTPPYQTDDAQRRVRQQSSQRTELFWALTASTEQNMLSGCGITQRAVCISYTRMLQATDPAGANAMCACRTLRPQSTRAILADYLIDAVVSLLEGNGPLILNARPLYDPAD